LSELGFAAAALPKCVKVAAVTGTNGKSTVTTFAGQVCFHSKDYDYYCPSTFY
jgi:UDP-N-acetylmuramoylalanine-D-glutamate ligase